MRIAQVAPLFESVPPRYYGGTERVVSHLTEELVGQGHEVTLFASADSRTHARLVAVRPQAQRLDPRCSDPLIHQLLMIEEVVQRAEEFDVIHFHTDYLHFPSCRRVCVPHVTTLHGRLDILDFEDLFQEFNDMPVVSISDSQRHPLSQANWQATVYHGLPLDLFTATDTPGDYIVFVGRICPEKRVDRATDIAKRFGMSLRIAAKIDPADREYFESQIAPLLDHPLVEYIGEIGDQHKDELIGNAYAMLFPIDWPEPFGLVMIEAMACGTPVIAYNRGSVPEVIDDGVNGFIVEDEDSAVRALDRVSTLDRKLCREVFEKRFSVERMANDYLEVYLDLRARSYEAATAA